MHKGLSVVAILVPLLNTSCANDSNSTGEEQTGGGRPDQSYASQIAYLYAEQFLELDKSGETLGVAMNFQLPLEMGGDRLSVGGAPDSVRNKGLARIEEEKAKAIATLSTDGYEALPNAVTVSRSGTCPKGAPSEGAAEITQEAYRFQLKEEPDQYGWQARMEGAIADNRVVIIVKTEKTGYGVAMEPLYGTLERNTVTLRDNSGNCSVIFAARKK